MTEDARPTPLGDPDQPDLADPDATRQPAEGGREDVRELPGAETAEGPASEEVDRDPA